MSKTETQSEALRLAEMLEKGPRRQGDVRIAAVLRGLDAENKSLLAALEAVEMDVVEVGMGESVISDSVRYKVEDVLQQIREAQAAAKNGGAA